MDRFLEVSDTARLCQVPAHKIEEWIDEGHLSAVDEHGSRCVSARELTCFLRSQRMNIPSELAGDGIFKILIVDDEGSMRRMLRLNLLEQFEGVSIVESGEGFHAGWRAQTLVPDLIILDIVLPGIDGYELCRSLRHRAELGQTRIIAISGIHAGEVREKIMSMGADEFLAKPFPMNALKQIIFDLLPDSRGNACHEAA